MRTLMIVAGIVLVAWLGFMALDRNQVHEELDAHDKKFEQYDSNFNSLKQDGVLKESNPLDQAEDEFDMKEDEFDKQLDMPYEENDTNQNTDLKPNDDNQNFNNEEQKPVEEQAPMEENPTNDEVEKEGLNEPAIPEKELNKDQQTNAQEDVVAFHFLDGTIFNPAKEAFELDMFDEAVDSVNAFQAR